MSVLDGLGAAMGVAGGAMRGYEASRGNSLPAPANSPGQGPLMQYLRHRKFQPKRPFDPSTASPSAPPDMSQAQQQMPDLGSLPMPQTPIPGMVGIGMGMPPQPPQPPQAPQGMYPPRNPYGAADAQQYATGGVVTKPTTAIIGEDGPEMIVPLTDRPDARVSRANLPQMQYRR